MLDMYARALTEASTESSIEYPPPMEDLNGLETRDYPERLLRKGPCPLLGGRGGARIACLVLPWSKQIDCSDLIQEILVWSAVSREKLVRFVDSQRGFFKKLPSPVIRFLDTSAALLTGGLAH